MQQNKFWFFCERELHDIARELQMALNLPRYERDYEDTWEWCESDSEEQDETGPYFNISREHNWEQGLYECPIILIIQNMNLPIGEIGSIISREFRVQVYYGQVSYERDGSYTYIVSKEWNR